VSTAPEVPRSATAPSCHEDGAPLAAPVGAPVVVLAGAPNVGKSTLFNALTGARRTVGNWPGTTVEVGRGGCAVEGRVADVVDLPGSYSLDPLSPDEALTRDVVLAEGDARPDVVVVVASAAHLARSLYLVAQVRETALPVVVALTMGDVAARRGIRVDAGALARAIGCPVVAIDPRRRSGVDGLLAAVGTALTAAVAHPRNCGTAPVPDELAAADERFGWIDAAVTASVSTEAMTRRTWSDRIDRFATAPVVGPLLFLGVMWLVFQATTTLAAPMQNALGALVDGPVTSAGGGLVEMVGLGDTPVRGLVVDGVIAGVGMLLTFVPLMALMFLLLALLEDSGYMARAAVVTDRMMSRLGLPGRAFLPIVVGFGCNVPAVSATRILPNARHRVLTALLVPFTSCSARLTVYVLLATTFFPAHAGTVVFAMYVVSILLVVLVGLGLRATLWRAVGADPLVIDLPPYQRPTLRLSLSVTWLRLQGFLRTASGIIVATVVIVWLLQSIPVGPGSFGDVPVSGSLYAELSRVVSPLMAPAGFGQWEAVSALLVGFVAKEAVISSWAQTYALAEPASSHDPGALGVQLHQTFAVASGGHTGAAVAAFMVFLLAYTPCVATLAAQRRELGTRWTVFGVGLQLVVAWTLAVVVFQVGRVFW
jgi:ferrous iron transport protein B